MRRGPRSRVYRRSGIRNDDARERGRSRVGNEETQAPQPSNETA